MLWIAFNLITFVDITQRKFLTSAQEFSCELLSIWLLLWISHSKTRIKKNTPTVVNCFQFDYFCGYHTAVCFSRASAYMLWIAFNLITFVDITQLKNQQVLCGLCCELLSIWLLLWISHSCKAAKEERNHVVNCFQFDYFCGYHTANLLRAWKERQLWIAFNLITFVDITQLKIWG